MELTERQRRLLWEMTTMADLDTLNDDLAQVHQEETGEYERDQLAAVLDPDGRFRREWSEGPRGVL